MKDICLIVYDECHHAMKDHPYNCVMREFYFNSDYRPKVLGLTACPTTGNYVLIISYNNLYLLYISHVDFIFYIFQPHIIFRRYKNACN